MNKRQRKKAEKKAIGRALKALVEYQPKGDEPCDDLTCGSCYREPDYPFMDDIPNLI